MENMEGSGTALLAIHYGIPCLEIRSASNLVGKRNIEAWDFTLASERAAFAIYKFIQRNEEIISSSFLTECKNDEKKRH